MSASLTNDDVVEPEASGGRQRRARRAVVAAGASISISMLASWQRRFVSSKVSLGSVLFEANDIRDGFEAILQRSHLDE